MDAFIEFLTQSGIGLFDVKEQKRIFNMEECRGFSARQTGVDALEQNIGHYNRYHLKVVSAENFAEAVDLKELIKLIPEQVVGNVSLTFRERSKNQTQPDVLVQNEMWSSDILNFARKKIKRTPELYGSRFKEIKLKAMFDKQDPVEAMAQEVVDCTVELFRLLEQKETLYSLVGEMIQAMEKRLNQKIT